jgi:hypothetical protein
MAGYCFRNYEHKRRRENGLISSLNHYHATACVPEQVIVTHCVSWVVHVCCILAATWGHATADNDMLAIATVLVPPLPAALTPTLIMACRASQKRKEEVKLRLKRLLQTKKTIRRGAL